MDATDIIKRGKILFKSYREIAQFYKMHWNVIVN